MPDAILVTGANGDIADAIGRILAEAYPSTGLIGADLAETGKWPGRRVFAEIHSLPRADRQEYTAELSALIDRIRPRLVIPTSEAELRKLALHRPLMNDVPLLMNAPDVILRCLDKLETARWIASIGPFAPFTTSLSDARPGELPLIIKPRYGHGSRGIETVRTAERLHLAQAERTDAAVAQALLEDEAAEFTCALFRWDGVMHSLAMRRTLIGGLTARITVESNDEIERVLRAIGENLPPRAVINVQLRLTAQGPRIFEINPRLSGTVMMRHRAGFSDLLWWIEATRGHIPPPFVAPKGLSVFRTYGEAVVEPHGGC